MNIAAKIALAALITSSASGLVLAGGADLYVEKNCITCHGTNGNQPVMDAYPRIGGQSEMYLLAQMKDIKTGARNNSHTQCGRADLCFMNRCMESPLSLD